MLTFYTAGESHGRGVFACISPWNFPLSIFAGQVTAALAAGNAVIAKPAEQTPLIAGAAVRILHEAGVPADVLHLLPGDGPSVGAPLVADPSLCMGTLKTPLDRPEDRFDPNRGKVVVDERDRHPDRAVAHCARAHARSRRHSPRGDDAGGRPAGAAVGLCGARHVVG